MVRHNIENLPAFAQDQKALKYYTQALPIERASGDRGNEAATLNNIGRVYFASGQVQEALKHLHTAYTARPDPEIAAHLGEVLWRSGQHEEAQKIWRAALTENPNHETLLAVMQKHRP